MKARREPDFTASAIFPDFVAAFFLMEVTKAISAHAGPDNFSEIRMQPISKLVVQMLPDT